MMPRWARALLISAVATGLAALAMNVVPGWKDPVRYRAADRSAGPRSREDVVDELSDAEKEQLLRELGNHV